MLNFQRFKGNFGYCPRASFLRQEKVVWFPSFDLFQIRINAGLFLTAKLLKQGYRYHKIRKAFSEFYHRHSELIVKYNIGLKTLLQ